jgi:acetolactate synthase-1/2/3 large subunit
MAGFRPASAGDLLPTLRRALDVDGPSLVEIPIDYRENLRLTEHLGALALFSHEVGHNEEPITG